MKHQITEEGQECHGVPRPRLRRQSRNRPGIFRAAPPLLARGLDWTPKHPEARIASRARLVEKQKLGTSRGTDWEQNTPEHHEMPSTKH